MAVMSVSEEQRKRARQQVLELAASVILDGELADAYRELREVVSFGSDAEAPTHAEVIERVRIAVEAADFGPLVPPDSPEGETVWETLRVVVRRALGSAPDHARELGYLRQVLASAGWLAPGEYREHSCALARVDEVLRRAEPDGKLLPFPPQWSVDAVVERARHLVTSLSELADAHEGRVVAAPAGWTRHINEAGGVFWTDDDGFLSVRIGRTITSEADPETTARVLLAEVAGVGR